MATHGDVDQVMTSGDSTFEEAFANTNLPIPLGPTAFWGPDGLPGEWSDVCGFIKPPGSETGWHIRIHGAFEFFMELLESNIPTRVATTKYGFISSCQRTVG